MICQQIVQNSTSAGNWTSVKLLWKAPIDGHLAGNITFRLTFIIVNDTILEFLQHTVGLTGHIDSL